MAQAFGRLQCRLPQPRSRRRACSRVGLLPRPMHAALCCTLKEANLTTACCASADRMHVHPASPRQRRMAWHADVRSGLGPRVCILGGGFGGLYTAVRLENLLWPDGRKPQVTLVDQSERFVFKPLLYELVNGGASADEVAPPFTQLLAPYSVNFVQAREAHAHALPAHAQAVQGAAMLAARLGRQTKHQRQVACSHLVRTAVARGACALWSQRRSWGRQAAAAA